MRLFTKLSLALALLLVLCLGGLMAIGIPLPEGHQNTITSRLNIHVKSSRFYLRPSLSPFQIVLRDVQRVGDTAHSFRQLILGFTPRGLMDQKPSFLGINGATFPLNQTSSDQRQDSTIPLAQIELFIPFLQDTGIHTLTAKNIHLIYGEENIHIKNAHVHLTFQDTTFTAKIFYKEAGRPRNHLKLVYEPKNHNAVFTFDAMDMDQILLYATGRSDIKLGSPLAGTLSLHLTPNLHDIEVTGALNASNQGRLVIQDLSSRGLDYRHLSVDISGTLSHLKAHGQISTHGPTATFDCTVTSTPAQWGDHIQANAHLSHLTHQQFVHYWPETLGTSTREWTIKNLSHGAVSDATIEVAWNRNKGALTLHHLSGGMTIHGMTVHYMDQMPDVHHVNGTATFDDKQFKITTNGGRVGDLVVEKGTLIFHDLAAHVGKTHIDLTISGPLTQMLEVADSPALRYPSSLGVTPNQMTGQATTRLDLKMPLGQDISTKDVTLHIESKIKKAAFSKTFRDPLGALDFTQGNLSLDITNERMYLNATARTKGVPVELTWEEHFQEKKPIKSTMSIKGNFSQEQQAKLKLPPMDWFDGDLGIHLEAQENRQAKTKLAIQLDLTPGHVLLPSFYEKQRGETAMLTLTIPDVDHATKHPVLFALQDLKGQVDGQLTVSEGFKLQALSIPKLLYNGSDAQLTWKTEKDAWDLDIHGKKINIASLLTHWHDAKKTEEPTPWNGTIHVSLQELSVNPKDPYSQVKGRMSHRGKHWTFIDLSAKNKRDGLTTLKLGPTPEGQVFDVKASSISPVGPLLTKNQYITGGELILHLDQKGAPENPWTGSLHVKNAAVRGVPFLVQILTIISPVSLVERLSGQGLVFSGLETDLTIENEVITLTNGKAANMAIGITFEGKVDQKSKTLDLTGHVIPAYLINSLIGKIPFVGEIIAGGKGQGMVSARYRVEGPFDSPKTSVNPLSVLTPGFTRKIFEQKPVK